MRVFVVGSTTDMNRCIHRFENSAIWFFVRSRAPSSIRFFGTHIDAIKSRSNNEIIRWCFDDEAS